MYLFKKEAEGDITHRRGEDNVKTEQKGFGDVSPGDCSGAATGQGMLEDTRSWKRQKQILH